MGNSSALTNLSASQDRTVSPLSLPEIGESVGHWCQVRPVQLCVLFGSQASGQVHSRSDVDLAIWPTHSLSPLTRLSWLHELETVLARDVSLVLVSPELDPVLGFEIVRTGRLVFEAKRGLWAERRAQLWHAFNDSLPFLRAARQHLHRFAQEIRHNLEARLDQDDSGSL